MPKYKERIGSAQSGRDKKPLFLERIIEAKEGEAAPEGAVLVSDDTPLSDWATVPDSALRLEAAAKDREVNGDGEELA